MNELGKTWTIQEVVDQCQTVWGMTPILKLACLGGSDEHWQIFHPRCFDYSNEQSEIMPTYTLTLMYVGKLERHPDADSYFTAPFLTEDEYDA